jgi:MHS family alpha-ketoglutarate permease-like MFS transporter
VSTQVQAAGDASHIDVADVSRRLKAIFIGSMGNLVEWYDFYAYTAFGFTSRPRSSRQAIRWGRN